MQAIQQLVPLALTAISEQPTTVKRRNIEEWAKWAKFQTFNEPMLEEMVNAVADFVLDMKNGSKPRWLSLVGTSGAGKTYLAKRVWKWFSESPMNKVESRNNGNQIVYPGQFCHWPDFADDLKANIGYGRLEDLKTEKFVVLDDVGQNRDASGHVTDKLSVLLSCRVNKWTIITANLGLEEIANKLDTRIASRMVRDGSIVVDVDVADYSLRRAA